MNMFRHGTGVVQPEVYDSPLAYTIEYVWGNLAVTQEADSVYGLNPLPPERLAGLTTFADFILEREGVVPPDINVLLCSQHEYPADISGGVTVAEATVLSTSRGVDITLASNRSREAHEIALSAQMAEATANAGINPEDIQLLGPDGEVVSFEETKSLLITHATAMQLAETAGYAAGDNMFTWQREYYNTGLLKSIRRLGYLGLGVGGLYLTAAATSSDNPGAEMVAWPLLYGGVSFALAYRAVRKSLTETESREAQWRRVTSGAGVRIRNDLHDTFCEPTFHLRPPRSS
jgi:hypothetical protein